MNTNKNKKFNKNFAKRARYMDSETLASVSSSTPELNLDRLGLAIKENEILANNNDHYYQSQHIVVLREESGG